MAKASKLIVKSAEKFSSFGEGAVAFGCFREGANASERLKRNASAVRSKRNCPLKLWKEVKAKNQRSGRKMSDTIFLAGKASGDLTIGDKHEIGRAVWRKPRGIRLTPTSRYFRDKLFP